MSKILDKNQVIKEKVTEQILASTSIHTSKPSVIQFGFYDNNGFKLPLSEIGKFWDRTEVERTTTAKEYA